MSDIFSMGNSNFGSIQRFLGDHNLISKNGVNSYLRHGGKLSMSEAMSGVYIQSLEMLSYDLDSSTEEYRHHLIAPVSHPLSLDLLPGPLVGSSNYFSVHPRHRDLRYMMYTVRPNSDYKSLSSKGLIHEIALDFLCFRESIEKSGINLDSGFKSFKNLRKELYSQVVLPSLPPGERPKAWLFYDLVNTLNKVTGVEREKFLVDSKNA